MPDNWIGNIKLTGETEILDNDGTKIHDLIPCKQGAGVPVDKEVYPLLYSKLPEGGLAYSTQFSGIGGPEDIAESPEHYWEVIQGDGSNGYLKQYDKSWIATGVTLPCESANYARGLTYADGYLWVYDFAKNLIKVNTETGANTLEFSSTMPGQAYGVVKIGDLWLLGDGSFNRAYVYDMTGTYLYDIPVKQGTTAVKYFAEYAGQLVVKTGGFLYFMDIATGDEISRLEVSLQTARQERGLASLDGRLSLRDTNADIYTYEPTPPSVPNMTAPTGSPHPYKIIADKT